MSPLALVFAAAAAAIWRQAPEDALTAVGMLGVGLAAPPGRGRGALVGALAAGLGLVALTRATSLWAWLLAFELMSLGMRRAGLTGDQSRNKNLIHYFSSICFLTSFILHEILSDNPYSAGLFCLGLGLRLGLSMATSPPLAMTGLTPIWGLLAFSAARSPLGLSAEAVAPWVVLALMSPALAAALGGRLAPALGLAQLGLGLAASFTLADPSWTLTWALVALSTGPLLQRAPGPLTPLGRAWAAGASPNVLVALMTLRGWVDLGLGALGGLLLLPSLVVLGAAPDAEAPSRPWLGVGLAAAALVAAWSLV